MGLFKDIFGKKEKESCCCELAIVEEGEDSGASCDCGGQCAEGTVVTVMGPGCKKCHQLNDNANQVATELGGSISVEYVTDPAAIAEAGVMSTPALLVDGKVVSQGKVLSPDEIRALL